uniref:Uncharacterized protein n=1 Tax=viral metagenome TaxID=1070528 RepID=A0A6M3LF73_9ZZZZ
MATVDKKLDKLCSEYVRKRAIQRCGGCERCNTPKFDIVKDNGSVFPAWKSLDWSHFHTRSNKKVRWNEDNAAGLCGGCHFYLDSHPHEKIAFFEGLLGDKVTQLEYQATRGSKPDKSAIELYLKQKIKELDV